MKRCPECGFRADDAVCPLCGVRMQEYAAPIRTHAHTRPGEKCALPNRERPTVGQETPKAYQPQNSRRNSAGKPSSVAVTLIVIVLLSVLRSCMR